MARTAFVTDSDRSNLELLTAVLIHEGFDVASSPDGSDALAQVLAKPPALLVCADNLSGVSPRELSRQARTGNPAIRIVLLVPEATMNDAPALTKATGVDAVLSTTLRLGEMRKLLQSWGLIEIAPRKPGKVSFSLPSPEATLAAPLAVPLPAAPLAVPDTGSSGIAIPPLPMPMAVPIPIPVPSPAGAELPDLDLAAAPLPAMSTPVAAPPATPTSRPGTRPKAAPVITSDDDGDGAALSLPPQGSLSGVPLPRLLYELYVATFSGIVRLERAGLTRSIFVWAGTPVRVDNNQVSETLGRILMEHGRITLEEYTRSLEIMQSRHCKQGEALVSMGVLTDAELLDALTEQTRIKLNSTFAWRDGKYKIEVRLDFVRDTILSGVNPLQAIWRGVHEHYDLDSLLTYFAPLGQSFAVASDLFKVHYETLGPLLRDAGIMGILDGKTRISAALKAATSKLQVAQALYVLLVTEMVRASNEPGAPVAAPDRLTTGRAEAVEPAEVARLTDELAHEYLRLKNADLFEALRLDFTAGAAEIDAAYNNIAGSLGLASVPAGLPEELLRRADEIRAILTRARDTLRDPQARERYLHQEQSRFAASEPPVADGHADGPPLAITSLEIDVTAGLAGHNAFSSGEALMDAGRFVEAAREFQRAIDACTTEPEYRVALGVAILKAEGVDNERARARVVQCLQQALQLDPSHIRANLEMAKLLLKTGVKDRAYSYVQKVLQRAPENQEARRLLASLG